jgi:hypothetical protein
MEGMLIGTKVGYSVSGIMTMYNRKGDPKETGGMGWHMMRGWQTDSHIKFLGIVVS